MNIPEILSKLTVEEKAILLTGAASMNTAEVERLGIRPVYLADGPHGVRAGFDEDCTAFPCLAMAGATWNKDLIYEMGVGIADDCIEHGINTILGPGINIKRTPVCGRNFEYFSEDPVLTGELTASYINGVQSKGVGACLKHFALNNQEKYRSETSIEVDMRVMREIYLKGFEIAVKKSNPYSVMCAYNKVYSIWCSENKFLLTDVLRNEWGYEGLMMSDWGAVRDICKAVTAGMDLQMPKNGNIVDQIKRGLENGAVKMEDVDRALTRLMKFIENNTPKKTEEYDRDKQHKIACKVASEGIVLLKNERNVLPITPEKYKKIAVIGGFAESPLTAGQGSAEVYASEKYRPSPLDELRARLGDKVEIKYMPIFDRRSFPDKMIWPETGKWHDFVYGCDAIIVFAGAMESEDTEQFDRRSLEYNPNYSFVIKHMTYANKNVILVNQSGSAMIFDDWKKNVPAIVHTWLGGEATGSAIADVLTGEVNPSGKLSETFPKVMRNDLEYPGDGLKVCYKEGFDVGYRYYDKHPEEIEYPFGHGLSYTSFKIENFELTKTDSTVALTLSITNTGDRDGSEVLQLYVSKEASCVSRPVKELKAFEKVSLKANETKRVTVSLEISDLAYFNLCMNEWVVEPGTYKIMLGTSSRNIVFTENIQLDRAAPYTVFGNSVTMIG